MKKNKKAFTLVEVLITIGIIGVVAAITIPTLLQNTNNHKFATRFKKTVSTLAQASLTSQAQYDMDYSSLSQDSNDTTCATDAIAKGNSTMCGLFNNTLAGHSYQGVYGTVKGANLSDPYTITYTTTGFNPEGNLIYALADGTLVGFKPTAKNCRLKPGNVLSSDVITSSEGLANCVGFIDVNGVQTPNKEVTCSSGTSEFSTSPCFIKSSGNAISDVFPIVFHDGTVEPATNAARAVLARGKSSAGDNSTGGGSDNTAVSTPKKTVMYKGNEYWYSENRKAYIREDENGNYVKTNGQVYTKNSDGKYELDGVLYDKDLKTLGKYVNNVWYDWYKGIGFVREDGNGNYVEASGTKIYTKTSNGYDYQDGSVLYHYDNNLNQLGRTINGVDYVYKGDNIATKYFHIDDNGNVIAQNGQTCTKTDAGYEMSVNGFTYHYDNDLNVVSLTQNGKTYIPKGNRFVYKEENGDYIIHQSGTCTKNSDGTCTYSGGLYDSDFNYIGTVN